MLKSMQKVNMNGDHIMQKSNIVKCEAKQKPDRVICSIKSETKKHLSLSLDSSVEFRWNKIKSNKCLHSMELFNQNDFNDANLFGIN